MLLEQATQIDPSFGMGWALLANTVQLMAESGILPAAEGAEQARELAQHALQLSPNNVLAHTVLVYIHLAFDRDWAAAQREAKRALALEPKNSETWFASGRVSLVLGRWEDAERQLLAALADNPLDTFSLWNLGFLYYVSGRFAESAATYERLQALEPNFPWTRPYLAKTLLALERPEAALAQMEQEADELNRLLVMPTVLLAAGRPAEADAALDTQVAKLADTSAFFVAASYAYRGDKDRALEWLERAYVQKDPSLIEIVGEPLFKNLAPDPRFKAFLRKMNLPVEPVPVNWQ